MCVKGKQTIFAEKENSSDKDMLYADVILPLALHNCLTYSVGEEIAEEVAFGKRVVVPLGKKKLYTAIVIGVHSDAPEYETKEVVSVIDTEPVITAGQLALWKWIAGYYMCTLGEVMKAALPSGLKVESETMVTAVPYFEAKKPLKKNEQAVLDKLSAAKRTSVDEIASMVEMKNVMPIVQRLLDMGAITTDEELKEGFKAKTVGAVRLAPTYMNEQTLNAMMDSLNKSPKQLQALVSYLSLSRAFVRGEQREVMKRTLIEKSGTTAAVVNALIEKGVLEQYDMEVSRLDNGRGFATVAEHDLSAAQSEAMGKIMEGFKSKNVCLLHGVTSCGKTEIYIKLIRAAINSGRQALFLLPEIALTTQITQRLQRVFGRQLGVYHSKFSDNERVEVWNAMLSPEKEYKVILGVRSSVFLPFRDLGLIIVDEEHENTYKQYDPAPRYHARNVAIVLAQMFGAKVLLGSATPSIDSYYNATVLGKYALVELNKRYADISLPNIEVVDVKEERRKKTISGAFTKRLVDEMKSTFVRGEQVILFQNRRGFAPYVECRSCAYVPRCIYCDVSLTLHKYTNELTCHYCGYTVQVPTLCPACANPTLYGVGLGTEKIEEEVKALFPEKNVARLDLDVAKSRKSYEEIISRFESGKIDVLVGTQMISKGLDFERVRLVGILRADGMLHYPDFRSHERAYQLMAQVSGRAGRKGRQGKVILQTSQPEHPVIGQVRANAYKDMYATQIMERQAYFYPPFCRVVSLMVKGRDEKKTETAAVILASGLRDRFAGRVYGPDVPVVMRIQSLYIRKIMVKLELSMNVAEAKDAITEVMNNMLAENKGVFVTVDVDPV